MLNAVWDFWLAINNVGTFVHLATAGLVLFAGFCIYVMTNSLALSALCAPILWCSGLATKYVLEMKQIDLMQDQDADVVANIAVGVLAGLVMLLALSKLYVMWSVWRDANLRPARPLPPAAENNPRRRQASFAR